MLPDFEDCYRAAEQKDSRFDGWIYCGVTSTGIYCRPSCPARTPKRQNIKFYPSAAAAQSAGFRACKRCRPDAAPGSPEWDMNADVVGRAMRLIADGVIEREGVPGLAAKLGYSERHVHRQMVERVGAGPLAVARSNRAQTARILLETTTLPIADVAFAAGFASVRQFNDTIRAVFSETPSSLRRRGASGSRGAGSAIQLTLPFRPPLAAESLFDFLALRAVAGVEIGDECGYSRTLDLPHGAGRVRLEAADRGLLARFELADSRDLGAAVERVRRLCDLDSDPTAADAWLARDVKLRPLVRARPGLRVPGCVSGAELAIRAVLGQQVSVKAATNAASRLTAEHGKRIGLEEGDAQGQLPDRLFPSIDAIAAIDPQKLPMPRKRAQALTRLAAEIAEGTIDLDGGSERDAVRESLTALPGIGQWTAEYIAMRALRDPDAFLPTDIGVRNGMAAIGLASDPVSTADRAQLWSPYRAYALQHLWQAASDQVKIRKKEK